MIGDRIARFRDPSCSGRPLDPFPAYLEQPESISPLEACWKVRPRFAIRAKTSLVNVPLGPRISCYGTGEQAGPLLRNGTRKTLWNNDNFDYTAASRNLYQSHPFLLAVRPDGSAFGIIVETTYRCDFDLSNDLTVRVHGPSPAVTVIERDSPIEVCRALATLTGHIPMPPRWALGYHQCRWSYEPQARVMEIAAEFRKRKIPCDVIWLDIDYMDGFRVFTFDREKFPDPSGMNVKLREQGFRAIYMIDPGVKVDPEDPTYSQGQAGHHFVQTADGGEYRGEVWPGDCAFPDFTREATRRWWAGLYADFMAHGIDGVWNDMNEPAVFKGVEKTMPVDNIHRADESLGGPGSHARYHNVYGMLMVRATREGIERANPSKRPFVLTRANFLGGHRYAATWTGDNRSDWNHLRWSIPMALNLSLSGQPFVGPDIGGFIGDADGELFARWMGIGALLPFARAHSEKTTRPHEPWSFGEACEATCRRALQRRYRLLPYLYTCFRNAVITGEPVIRPVFFADPTDPRLRSIDDAFLLGPDVLVQCSVNPGVHTRRPPILNWPALQIDELDDPQLPDLFLRPGAAVPVGPLRNWTDEPVGDSWEMFAALNSDNTAVGELYCDHGDGYQYQTGGYCRTRWHVTVTPAPGAPLARMVEQEGSFSTPPAPARVHLCRTRC